LGRLSRIESNREGVGWMGSGDAWDGPAVPSQGYYGRFAEYLLPREHFEGQVTPLALTNCQREPQP